MKPMRSPFATALLALLLVLCACTSSIESAEDAQVRYLSTSESFGEQAVLPKAFTTTLAQAEESVDRDLATSRAVREPTESPDATRQKPTADSLATSPPPGSSGFGGVLDSSVPEKLFNGENLEGWEPVGESSGGWDVADGVLYTDGSGGGWLSTTGLYRDFVLSLEYRVPEGGNSGVFLRAPREGNPAYQGLEIQILDDYAEQYSDLDAWQYAGSIYDVKAPSKRVSKPAGEWQRMEIVADGPVIQVTLNGEMIVNANLINYRDLADEHPGLKRRSGYIGLQNHSTRIEYRNIFIHEIERAGNE